jgi:hypothetical protein
MAGVPIPRLWRRGGRARPGSCPLAGEQRDRRRPDPGAMRAAVFACPRLHADAVQAPDASRALGNGAWTWLLRAQLGGPRAGSSGARAARRAAPTARSATALRPAPRTWRDRRRRWSSSWRCVRAAGSRRTRASAQPVDWSDACPRRAARAPIDPTTASQRCAFSCRTRTEVLSRASISGLGERAPAQSERPSRTFSCAGLTRDAGARPASPARVEHDGRGFQARARDPRNSSSHATRCGSRRCAQRNFANNPSTIRNSAVMPPARARACRFTRAARTGRGLARQPSSPEMESHAFRHHCPRPNPSIGYRPGQGKPHADVGQRPTAAVR